MCASAPIVHSFEDVSRFASFGATEEGNFRQRRVVRASRYSCVSGELQLRIRRAAAQLLIRPDSFSATE